MPLILSKKWEHKCVLSVILICASPISIVLTNHVIVPWERSLENLNCAYVSQNQSKKTSINIFARISLFIPNDYDIDWYPILDGLYLFLTIVATA